MLGNGEKLDKAMTPQQHMYIVGGLAMYVMILGKENSSGHWCYLCILSAKEFSDLYKTGDPLTYEFMNECTKEAKQTRKSVKGVKEEAWWQFIPLSNILVPLLHLLIGIGNDILITSRTL